MRMVLPVFGLAVVFSFAAVPAMSQETCAQQADKMKEALYYSVMSTDDKEKIAGQISQGLDMCNKNESDPWKGVDPRINKG